MSSATNIGFQAKALSLHDKNYEIKDVLHLKSSLQDAGTCLISGRNETDSSNEDRIAANIFDAVSKQKMGVNKPDGRTSTDSKDISFYKAAVDKEQVEKTITAAFSLLANLRDVPNDDTNVQLRDYILKVFSADDDTIRKLWVKAVSQEKPEELLIVHVKHGSELIPMDANNKSDPYVKVGIIDATLQGEAVQKKKNLKDWKKDRKVMPTGEIKESSVQKATLEPQWNEDIELSTGKVEHEMLVLEVWDNDDEIVAPTNISGLKHLLRDLCRTDDFMGRAFLSLWTLRSRTEDKVLELFSYSGKDKCGTITVDLTVKQVKTDVPLEVGMKEHLQLTLAVINHESCVDGEYQRKWRGVLSEQANKLLDKHAEFCDLSESHKAAIRLSVLVKYHLKFAVKMSTFSALIKKIVFLESEINDFQARGSMSSKPQTGWVSVLLKDLVELAMDIEEVLKNHLTVYNIINQKDVEKIRHRVDILLALYAFPPFVAQLPPEKRHLHLLLEKSIRVAVPKWLINLQGRLSPEKNTPEMQLFAFQDLMSQLLFHCTRIIEQLNPVYERAGVDYFTQFYLTIDKLILEEAISKLKLQEDPKQVTTYEIYKTMKKIRKLRCHIDKRHHRDLKIICLHKWFADKVNHWITMAMERIKNYIKQAIQEDKVVQVTDEVQFSSSAIEGASFLIRLMKLDSELEWPSKPEALTFRVFIVKSVCDCALFYVGEVFRSLEDEDMFDEQGRFMATEKLCIKLNNMEHIKQVIVNYLKGSSEQQSDSQGDPEDFLDLSNFPGVTEAEKREAAAKQLQKVQEHSAEVMGSVIQSATEDIQTKIIKIVYQITRKMSPEVTRLLGKILESKPAASNNMEAVIDPLMMYMTSNLQTLHNYLLTPVFRLILQDIWTVSCDCLAGTLKQNGGKKSSPDHYHMLKYTLNTLQDFFYAGGKGLVREDLETKTYKDLAYRLDILSLQTDKLIFRFFSDLADMQLATTNSGEARFGKTLLSIGYHEDREVIEVNLIQANNLPALDSSGFSDPFVEFSLMPPWAFGQINQKKICSSIKKKDLNPVFNEDLMIPAAKEPLQTEGTVLLLTIFDHDRIGSNDLCGICVVPCADIPILSPISSAFDNPNAIERKTMTLPLFRITQSTIALKELNTRAQNSDSMASEFLKINKQILADVERRRSVDQS